MRISQLFLALILLNACSPSKNADLIIHNATIYMVDDAFGTAEAMAIKDGRIIAIGAEHQILNSYQSEQTIDAALQFIYPGFIDAHSHFLGYGNEKQQLDLVGTTSFEEVVSRISEYISNHEGQWIRGRGWDQNDWDVKEFPTNETLNKLFPDYFIVLKRVDGHAVLVSDNVLKLAGVDSQSRITGGEIRMKNGKLTGILLDEAEELIKPIVPNYTEDFKLNSLKTAQEDCFALGLTTVCDGGLSKEEIDLIHESQMTFLKMRIYAMYSANNDLIDQLHTIGHKTERLTAKSIKLYADGALGSRGAALLEPYSDDTLNSGLIIAPEDSIRKWAKACFENNFQLNVHCIGDRANRITLDAMGSVLKTANDRRWRIEHAQVVNQDDQSKFGAYTVIPSMQPTHATSDMYWAEDRLGPERIDQAYALKSLMNQNGLIALGTDFPVEDISPIKTFYAATVRKDLSGFPENGFNIEESLSRQEALRGITIWPAVANFEDSVKGSLEVGKYADFVMLDQDLIRCSDNAINQSNIIKTWVNGELVYTK